MAKKSPPRPKSTANLPPGLAKYWAAKGVPSKAPAGSSSSKTSSTKKKKTTSKKKKKTTAKKTGK
jgi:hypothetical protein